LSVLNLENMPDDLWLGLLKPTGSPALAAAPLLISFGPLKPSAQTAGVGGVDYHLVLVGEMLMNTNSCLFHALTHL
jgi:hypothetical protein